MGFLPLTSCGTVAAMPQPKEDDGRGYAVPLDSRLRGTDERGHGEVLDSRLRGTDGRGRKTLNVGSERRRRGTCWGLAMRGWRGTVNAEARRTQSTAEGLFLSARGVRGIRCAY